tara:strand:- start:3625 stop:3831 length:207 start_codon:yes stop_codon:yes gene_type:complete
MTAPTFKHTLNEELKTLNMSRDELVELIGCSYRAAQDWQLGTKSPNSWVQKLVLSKLRARKPPAPSNP